MNKIQMKLNTDAGLIASDIPTARILEIELTAPEASGNNSPAPLNLGLVIDRSGSMSGGKLEQARQAAEQIVNLLRPRDSVSIVSFDDQVRLESEANSVDAAARTELIAAVRHIHSGGSTNLGGGWLTGCECVGKRQKNGSVNRTLLLTDGQANVGITSTPELTGHAAELFERGIATSTFGIGEGFNEHLLEGMANRGGGNYYFIESAAQISGLLMEEFHDLAAVTVKNVIVELNFPAGVGVELFGDWKAEQHEHKYIVHFSDLSANRKINFYARLLTPPGSGQLVMNALVSGLDEEDRPFQAAAELTLQYASQAKVKAAEKDHELETRFSTVAVGQLSNEALKLEREGKRDEAKRMMNRIMSEFGEHLPAPTRLRYEQVSESIELGFNEFTRKSINMDTYLLRRNKHDDQR